MFEAIKLDAAAVKAHEEDIRLRVRELDDTARKAYYEQFGQDMKDPDTYAILNYFFLTGLHHMYLGDFTRGAINLSILIAGIGLMLTGFSLFGGLAIGFIIAVELMALFRSQVVVANHNNLLSERILNARN